MKWFCHRNCTYILPGRIRDQFRTPDMKRQWRERTHGCWCASWRQLANGQLRIWRDGAWRKPKPGELRTTTRPPP